MKAARPNPNPDPNPASERREKLRGKLRERRLAGNPIWAAARADLEMTARGEMRDADFRVFHPDYKPEPGTLLGSLRPFGNSNDRILRALSKKPFATATPWLAGLCGSDPSLLPGPVFHNLQAWGITGVHNFPTLGLLDGIFRENLEASHIGWRQEVDLVAAAHAAHLFTAALVFEIEAAHAMAAAGADVVIIHLGLDSVEPWHPRLALQHPELFGQMLKRVKTESEAWVLCHEECLGNLEDAPLLWTQFDALDGFFSTALPTPLGSDSPPFPKKAFR